MNLLTDSLWIGRLFKERLEKVVPVYPCVAPANAPAEFCVYRRDGYAASNSKDRYNYEETFTITLSVVASTYDRSIELAQSIKDRLDGLRGKFEGKPVTFMQLINATEEYSEACYVQRLTFSLSLDTSNYM